MFFELFLRKIPQMKKIIVFCFLFTSAIYSQSADQQMLKDIYKYSLTQSRCYSWLDDLSNKIGARLSGSAGAEKSSRLHQTAIGNLRS